MKVVVLPEQMVVANAETVTDGVTSGLIVMVTLFELAVSCVTQASELVIIQLTTSPLLKLDDA